MKTSTLLGLALWGGAGGLAYARFFRPRVLNWGATEAEIEASMPGDEILPDATLQTTRVVTIDAPAETVWPWLVQMGPRPRAGAYTYDWVERLLGIDIENKDRILPEYQRPEVGEFMGLGKKGEGLVVRAIEPERFLVLQWEPQKSTWTFALYPEGEGKTRLVSRNRLPDVTTWFGLPGWRWLLKLFVAAFMEPGSLVMERKMLLGIKERAQRLWREKEGSAIGHSIR